MVTIKANELRYAAENNVPVWMRLIHYNPHDKHKNQDEKVVLEKATTGWYIGNTDIDLDIFQDDELVSLDLGDSFIVVYKITGLKYGK